MTPQERAELVGMLADLGAMYGREITAGATAMYCAALDRSALADVRAALSAHVADAEAGKWMPKPADVIGRLQAADGRPTAEEAWALVPPTEAGATVWTDECAAAAGAAQPLLARGDEAGARMAFRQAYDRAVHHARTARIPVRWWLSRGHDRADDDRALVAAVAAGRLTHDAALRIQPTLGLPAPSAEALRLAGSTLRRIK
jgi:hypothetical protein